jgi:hypothetical protein
MTKNHFSQRIIARQRVALGNRSRNEMLASLERIRDSVLPARYSIGGANLTREEDFGFGIVRYVEVDNPYQEKPAVGVANWAAERMIAASRAFFGEKK